MQRMEDMIEHAAYLYSLTYNTRTVEEMVEKRQECIEYCGYIAEQTGTPLEDINKKMSDVWVDKYQSLLEKRYRERKEQQRRRQMELYARMER